MVQRRITRRTFEHKRREAEVAYLLFEKTICTLTRLYMGNIHSLAEDLHDMANLDSIEVYIITDEELVEEELPVFASKRQIVDYLYARE